MERIEKECLYSKQQLEIEFPENGIESLGKSTKVIKKISYPTVDFNKVYEQKV